ncbi:Alpha/Beta hydrolase protein [Parasitella parasitica]|nr:Alpha/Beta hydrolase protein [Parasitella parasitica]
MSATSKGRQFSLYKSVSTNIITLTVIWACLEIAFFVYFVNALQKLQQTTKPKKPLDQSERTSLFWNCVHTIPDLSTWAEGWFYYKNDCSHPKFSEIKRENLALWFAWAFWHEHLDIVRQNKEWADEIEWMLITTEEWFHVKFAKGLNANLQCIRLSLDPLEAVHRPLIVYVGLYMITAIFNTAFLEWSWGFTHSRATIHGIEWGGPLAFVHDVVSGIKKTVVSITSDSYARHHKKQFRLKHLSYWYRAPTDGSTTRTPLVFIHGIGAGVICYTEFVRQLANFDRPIFLIELPYVAMHMVDHVPTAAETVLEINEMLQTYGYENAIFVSHSLGTGVSSWILNRAPNIVAGVVMIDPICFLLHYHNVAFNFVHRKPKTLFEHLMHFGAARELYISNYISRHFQWFETIFFTQPANVQPATLPPLPTEKNSPLANASIFLSEKDGIVGSGPVLEYLLARGVDAHIMDNLEHAMFLTSTKWKDTIASRVDTIARKADYVSLMMNKQM